MKRLVIFCSAFVLGFNLSAQEVGASKTPTQKEPKEVKEPKEAEDPKKKKEPKSDKKSTSEDKRVHAEEKSDGNAFSGNGNGGDKNLVDPENKSKKEKKPKKDKKAK